MGDTEIQQQRKKKERSGDGDALSDIVEMLKILRQIHHRAEARAEEILAQRQQRDSGRAVEGGFMNERK